jgi:pimeloyl-ACP methyl ester carboxylesterase
MGGGIASFIANEFDKISKLVLLDPFNFGYASSHRKLFVLALSVAKPFPAAVSPLLVKNPEVPSFDPRVLLLSMYKESFLDEMNQNVKKNNKPTLIIFGEKDDVINPVLSTNYFNEVCYDKKCVIKIMKNQKHSPHVYAVNETLNIVLSFIKHGK